MKFGVKREMRLSVASLLKNLLTSVNSKTLDDLFAVSLKIFHDCIAEVLKVKIYHEYTLLTSRFSV